MARYMERAENLARLIEVHREDLMDLVWSGESTSASWRPLIQVLALEEIYKKVASDGGRSCPISEFLTVAPENLENVSGCIAAARENARAVRDQISDEMWLSLNALHLHLRAQGAADWKYSPQAFCEQIIEASLRFQGITDATIPHGEGWAFIQLGKYIERADKTSRFLDMPHFLPDVRRNPVWHTVLRACSATASYRGRFGGEVSAANATSILIFSSSFPRSVRFCMRQINDLLHLISNTPPLRYSHEAERLAGATLARLDFAGQDEVAEMGLHDYIDSLQGDLNRIGLEIYAKYFLIGDDPAAPPAFQSQFQSQSMVR